MRKKEKEKKEVEQKKVQVTWTKERGRKKMDKLSREAILQM